MGYVIWYLWARNKIDIKFWVGNELKQMDQRTRKLMTMHKALHPRDKFDRLYVSRKEGGKELPASKTALSHRYNDSKAT